MLHDVLNNYFQGIQNKIIAAKLILTNIGNNSVTIVDGIYSFFPSPSPAIPEYLKDFGLLGEWVFEWTKKNVPKISPGEYIGPDLKKSVQDITVILDVFEVLIQSIITQNNTVNK
jgi:hypothetical protein